MVTHRERREVLDTAIGFSSSPGWKRVVGAVAGCIGLLALAWCVHHQLATEEPPPTREVLQVSAGAQDLGVIIWPAQNQIAPDIEADLDAIHERFSEHSQANPRRDQDPDRGSSEEAHVDPEWSSFPRNRRSFAVLVGKYAPPPIEFLFRNEELNPRDIWIPPASRTALTDLVASYGDYLRALMNVAYGASARDLRRLIQEGQSVVLIPKDDEATLARLARDLERHGTRADALREQMLKRGAPPPRFAPYLSHDLRDYENGAGIQAFKPVDGVLHGATRAMMTNVLVAYTDADHVRIELATHIVQFFVSCSALRWQEATSLVDTTTTRILEDRD